MSWTSWRSGQLDPTRPAIRRRRGKMAVQALIVAALLAVGSVWWWAFFGMSTEIGTAIGSTITVIVVAAFLCAVAMESPV